MIKANIILIFLASLFSLSATSPLQNQTGLALSEPEIERFSVFFSSDKIAKEQTLQYLDRNWKDEYTVMVLETVYLLNDLDYSFKLTTILHEKTGQQFGYEFNDWYRWLWNKKEHVLPDYADFKAKLYSRLDGRFKKYFEGRYDNQIRLDEVVWGGVAQDGIPPLRDPEMINATEAQYLEDDNVVFGIEVNGDVRAYPKRILAWHEMFVDEVGGVPVVGVYCTLCGTVILYKSEHNGINHEMGTSGFLYRSNKLMYDKATQSLWNTLWGEPVIGPLAGKGIALEHMSVVTTTWGEWKKRHPETQVLSLKTGHTRDYGEGVAYHNYFATDQLMFNIPKRDRRLKNKDEVLALRLPAYPEEQLAISARYLSKHPIYHDKVGEVGLVVLTDESGANRVYETNGQTFSDYDQQSTVIDNTGEKWTLHEDKLISTNGDVLKRLPYHRAFWFGWHSAYPKTRLVK
ncbi:MAG: DUF3179 domain-containing protein [Bacteroidota bacterium]